MELSDVLFSLDLSAFCRQLKISTIKVGEILILNCCKRLIIEQWYEFHDSLFLQIQCWRSVDASYNCVTDDELVGIEGNIIDEEIEKAKNQSDFLGDQSIASCGIIASQVQKRQDIVDQ